MKTLTFFVTKPSTLTREGYVIPASTARYGCWCKKTGTNLIQLAHLHVGDLIHEEGQLVRIKDIRVKEGPVTQYELDVEIFDVRKESHVSIRSSENADTGHATALSGDEMRGERPLPDGETEGHFGGYEL